MLPLTKELSYILGVLFGDGNLINNSLNRTYQFRLTSIDLDFIDEINRCIKLLTGKNGRIYQDSKRGSIGKKDKKLLVVCSKELVEYLEQITLGVKVIPNFILEDRGDYIKEFTAGLFDSDGWISKSKKGYYQLGIAKTKTYLDDLMLVLVRIGIRWSRKVKSPSGISKKDLISYNVKITDFIKKGFYFKIIRKQKRLNDYKLNILEKMKI